MSACDGEAEVAQLEHPVLVEQQVGLLEVAVQHVALVHGGERRQELHRETLDLRLGEGGLHVLDEQPVRGDGEAREVHHHCLLIGFGADAINPYVAFEALWQSQLDNLLDANEYPDIPTIVEAYRKGVAKGMLKVMAKMGISTLQSYKGAQIFEVVGLADDIVDRCFSGTASRIQGVNFKVLCEEMIRRHELGYPSRETNIIPVLPNPGDIHWRKGGDTHMWDPTAIANLQLAARTNSRDAYWQFAEHANNVATRNATLRGLFKFKEGTPVPLEEIEPAKEIVKRF